MVETSKWWRGVEVVERCRSSGDDAGKTVGCGYRIDKVQIKRINKIKKRSRRRSNIDVLPL